MLLTRVGEVATEDEASYQLTFLFVVKKLNG
jgi:hypothetical protein